MGEWWAQNWGNVASVIGLALSVWALYVAKNAKTAVANFRKKQQLFGVIIDVEHALSLARTLTQARGRQLPRGRCDLLREKLASLRNAKALSSDERDLVSVSVVWFHRPLVNNTDMQSQLRQLVDVLIAAGVRFREMLEENIA